MLWLEEYLRRLVFNSPVLHSRFVLSTLKFIRLTPNYRLLAPLHGIDYLTPSLVMLAARKVFRHRIIVATPDDDRSLQYGSDLATVSQILADVTPDSILDGVLALEPPI